MQLSIIIVNYNVKHFLEQCLYSVRKAIRGIAAEVIVVDNHSKDNSLSWLKPRFPEVQFIANTKNLGFAKANNIGLALCTGRFVLFLNPDTLVPENTISKSLIYLNQHPEAAALGIRMVDGNGRFLAESKRSFPSPMASFFKLVGLASVFPQSGVFNKYALGNLDHQQTTAVPVLAGACMLVRKTILDQLNGFDESYFMYGEDIDLSYRIQQLGMQNHYFADTTILHFKGKSALRERFGHVKNFYTAMLVFVRKHYKKGAAKTFSFLIQPAIALRAMLAIVRRLLPPVMTGAVGAVTGKTIIVGSESEYSRVIDLFSEALPKEKVLGRVSVDANIENALCCLQDLGWYGKKLMATEILFCEGDLPVSAIVEQVSFMSDKNTRFLFHMKGSESIVGSEAASLRGRVFSNKDQMSTKA